MAAISCKHGSWLLILLITLHLSSHGGANSCYEGMTEDGTDNPEFPVVKQCAAREKRDSPSPTSPTPTPVQHHTTIIITEPTPTTVNLSTPKTVPTSPTTNQPTPPLPTRAPGVVPMCLRFAVEKSSGSLKVGKAVEWKVQYGCDTNNLCQGKNGTFDHKVTWNGERGTLYCCNKGNNCNSPVVQSCYSGQIGKKRLVKAPCSADTRFCVSSLDHVNGTVVGGLYSCSVVDYRDVCINNGFTEPGCKNVTGPTGKQSTVCCCNTNNCNVPVNVTHPANPGTHSPSSHPKHHHTRSINYAVPTAATIIIILVILTAVGGLCVWKKKRETGTGALSFTYSRLAADVAV
ncbi:uncharacterized protein LOC144905197 [Branchiostoma floridae x Branchiostoma belcheri]